MVNLALKQSKLIHGTNASLAKQRLPIDDSVGILYPSKNAIELASLEPQYRPDQLILIDGTWAHAKTMVRDIPQLHHLQHFKLAPTTPGRYRIRLEPTDTSLSTVEAAVEALRELEPETTGLDQLLQSFEWMVQQQLDHPSVGTDHYSHGPRSGSTLNVPAQLLAPDTSIVVVYGEASFRNFKQSSGDQSPRKPIYWLAERIASEEFFEQPIEPEIAVTDSFLEHLELKKTNFDNAISVESFRERWRAFLRPDDLLVSYSQGSIDLLKNIDADFCESMLLKSINFDSDKRGFTKLLEDRGLPTPVPTGPGRAGKRLANAVSFVKLLRSKTS